MNYLARTVLLILLKIREIKMLIQSKIDRTILASLNGSKTHSNNVSIEATQSQTMSY